MKVKANVVTAISVSALCAQTWRPRRVRRASLNRSGLMCESLPLTAVSPFSVNE
jgi:hypothetical protein